MPDTSGAWKLFVPGGGVEFIVTGGSERARKIVTNSLYGHFGPPLPHVYFTWETSLSDHTRRRIKLARARFFQT